MTVATRNPTLVNMQLRSHADDSAHPSCALFSLVQPLPGSAACR